MEFVGEQKGYDLSMFKVGSSDARLIFTGTEKSSSISLLKDSLAAPLRAKESAREQLSNFSSYSVHDQRPATSQSRPSSSAMPPRIAHIFGSALTSPSALRRSSLSTQPSPCENFDTNSSEVKQHKSKPYTRIEQQPTFQIKDDRLSCVEDSGLDLNFVQASGYGIEPWQDKELVESEGVTADLSPVYKCNFMAESARPPVKGKHLNPDKRKKRITYYCDEDCEDSCDVYQTQPNASKPPPNVSKAPRQTFSKPKATTASILSYISHRPYNLSSSKACAQSHITSTAYTSAATHAFLDSTRQAKVSSVTKPIPAEEIIDETSALQELRLVLRSTLQSKLSKGHSADDTAVFCGAKKFHEPEEGKHVRFHLLCSQTPITYTVLIKSFLSSLTRSHLALETHKQLACPDTATSSSAINFRP